MIIPARFNGPPGTGNGGYSAGLVAGLVPGQVAEVTLRLPPPLDTPLSVVRSAATVQVYDDSRLVAEARPVEPFDAAVPPVSFWAAAEASRWYDGFTDHPFPTCFVCGPKREPGDGLRVFPGRLPDGRTAAPFVVPEDVSAAMIWASLDCPGGWAVISSGRPYVLGRMAATVAALPRPGDQCVVVGATVAVHGRKADVRSSLYGPDGTLLAAARATWIALPA
ncbi:MAG TPA: hypothetical protein VFR67_05025 [Pilimelia sp.]|nr:hypothetical protein [Pilimelia sp.]